MTDSDRNPNDILPGANPTPPGPQAQTPAAPPSPGETAPHSRPDTPSSQPPVHIGGNVGGDVAGGDLNKELNAGRDIVGRDVVTNTTNFGFSIAAVQRLIITLVITVGGLVFVTAACFFSGGVAAGAGIIALTRTVDSTNEAADRFAAALAALQSLPPGTPFQLAFTEQEMSSYFRMRVAPTLPGQITDGKVRLLDSGQVVIGGNARSLGGLAFATTFDWQSTPGRPLRLTDAAIQVLPAGHSVFGWVAVPTAALSWVEDSVNGLFGRVQITGIAKSADGQVWTVAGVTQ